MPKKKISKGEAQLSSLISRAEWHGQQILKLSNMCRPLLLTSIESKHSIPKLRFEMYLEAQWAAEIRECLTNIFVNRKWNFVTMETFLRETASRVQQLAAFIQAKAKVIFYIDSYDKSSFWMLLLCLEIMMKKIDPSHLNKVHVYVRRATHHAAFVAFLKKFEKTTMICFFDDASYSGVQLTKTVEYVYQSWKQSGNKTRPDAFAFVVYASSRARSLFKHLDLRTSHPLFIDNVLGSKTLADLFRIDLFLVWHEHSYSSEYWSYLFHFLQLRRYQTLTFFEHKLPDALSLPDYLLLAGPCIPTSITTAFRVRRDKCQLLADLLLSEVQEQVKRNKVISTITRNESFFTEAFARMQSLLHSEKFRNEFMESIAMTQACPSKTRWPAFLPVINPGSCTNEYRKLLKQMQASPAKFLTDASNQSFWNFQPHDTITPTCYTASYKHMLRKLLLN